MERRTGVSNNCQDCPILKLREALPANCRRACDKWMKADSPTDDEIEALIESVGEIISLANIAGDKPFDEEWTLSTLILVNIWRDEEQIAERIKRWNEREK